MKIGWATSLLSLERKDRVSWPEGGLRAVTDKIILELQVERLGFLCRRARE